MKNIKQQVIRFITIHIALFIIGFSYGQPSFEGKVTYGLKYTEIPEEIKGYESMLPQNMHMYFKESKLRTETPTIMGGNQVVIFDRAKNEGAILMDMMGDKQAITMSSEYLKSEEKAAEGKTNIKYYDEYKTIAGYRCQKATIEIDDLKTTVYFTKQIPNLGENFKGLPGLPMEYTIYQNGVTTILTVTEVTKEYVDDRQFIIPEDYVTMPIEEFMKMNGE